MRISDWSSDVCSSDLLDQLIVDRRGDRDPRGAGKRPAKLTLRGAPRELTAAMLGGLERDGFAQRGDAALLHLGDGESCVGTADIARNDWHSVIERKSVV